MVAKKGETLDDINISKADNGFSIRVGYKSKNEKKDNNSFDGFSHRSMELVENTEEGLLKTVKKLVSGNTEDKMDKALEDSDMDEE